MTLYIYIVYYFLSYIKEGRLVNQISKIAFHIKIESNEWITKQM